MESFRAYSEFHISKTKTYKDILISNRYSNLFNYSWFWLPNIVNLNSCDFLYKDVKKSLIYVFKEFVSHFKI